MRSCIFSTTDKLSWWAEMPETKMPSALTASQVVQTQSQYVKIVFFNNYTKLTWVRKWLGNSRSTVDSGNTGQRFWETKLKTSVNQLDSCTRHDSLITCEPPSWHGSLGKDERGLNCSVVRNDTNGFSVWFEVLCEKLFFHDLSSAAFTLLATSSIGLAAHYAPAVRLQRGLPGKLRNPPELKTSSRRSDLYEEGAGKRVHKWVLLGSELWHRVSRCT